MGLEPTNGGTTIRCLNLLATLAIAQSNIAFCLYPDPGSGHAPSSLGCHAMESNCTSPERLPALTCPGNDR